MKKLLFFLGVFFLPVVGWPAQDTTVVVDNAPILEEPKESGKVIEYLPIGLEIRISTYPMPGGYYKVRSKTGVYGWIQEQNLSVSKLTEDERADLIASGVNPGEPRRLFIRGLAGFSFFRPSDINDVFGFTDLNTGYNFGGEVGYFLSKRFSVLARAEYLTKDVVAKEATTGTTYNLGIRSYPVMIGADLFFLKLPAMRLSLGLLAGVAIATSFTSEAYNLGLPNTVHLEHNSFTSLARLNLTRPLARFLSVFVECGYRYLKSKELDTTNNANGGALYLKDSTYQSRTIDLSGVILSVGLGLHF